MKDTQKNKFFLWFQFLKIAQLHPPFLYGQVRWERYDAWGPVRNYESFEKWWSDYGRKLQNPVVNEIERIPENPLPNTMYLAIPLNRSPIRLARRARHIIEARIEKTYQSRVLTQGEKRKTFRRGFYGSAWFTEGRDIRVSYYRNLLDIYEAVFKTPSGPIGMKTLTALNVIGAKNAVKNAVYAQQDKKKQWNDFKKYTTYWQTSEQLAKIPTRSIQENHLVYNKRAIEESAAARAAGEDVSEQCKPLRKITPLTEEEKRVDYINNENARMAIQNLRRAKNSLKIVVNAVARGEFPGSKV